MTNNYVFAVIGAGMIAREHLKNLAQFSGTRVKWLVAAPNDTKQLKEVSKEFGVSSTTTDYKETLKDSEVDAVIICTPPFTHKMIFEDCIESGKHVLLEKPTAIDEGDLDEMIRLSKQHPELKVCDASCRHSRLQPKFAFVKDIIESGELGDIYYIHHNALYRQSRPGIEYHPEAKWFLDKSKAGGGLMLDWGVYDFSFHLGILGDKPKLKSAQTFTINGLDNIDTGTHVFDVEEHFVSLMNFDTGLKYYWERAAHANVEEADKTRIYGTRGGLKFSYLSWESPEIQVYKLDKKNKAIENTLEVPFDSHEDDGYELIRHFIAVLDGKEDPQMPLDLAAKHIRISLDNYRKCEEL